jgi:hypothetical protein
VGIAGGVRILKQVAGLGGRGCGDGGGLAAGAWT